MSNKRMLEISWFLLICVTICYCNKEADSNKILNACKKIYIDNNIKLDENFQILDGGNATLGQFPHVGVLGFENTDGQIGWHCGASLISSRFLLTVAHCFICNGCSDPIKARFGTIEISDSNSAQDVDIKRVIAHPDFSPVSKHNDIAIVELARDVKISKNVYPACLYTEADDPVGLQVLGFGSIESLTPRDRFLQYDVIEPIPIRVCNTTISTRKFSTKVILDTQICAPTKSNPCLGMSGDPLQIKKKEGGYAIVGVLSYGFPCATELPVIYTRVAKYLDWIKGIVWPEIDRIVWPDTL